MNRHTAMTVAAAIVIAAPFAYWSMSVAGVQQMEYRWSGPGMFSFFALSNHGEMEFCNAAPLWMGFEKLEVAAFFEERHLGTFVTGPVTAGPLESSVAEGAFASETISESQHIFMTMDFEFDGGDIRLDPNRFTVITRAHTPVMGVIPHYTEVQMNGFDFDQMMNAHDLVCD